MAKNTAKSPCGKTVRIGRIGDLKLVHNQNAKPAAASTYLAIRVQNDNGAEVALLFTKHEIDRAINRAMKNREDVPTAASIFDNIIDALD